MKNIKKKKKCQKKSQNLEVNYFYTRNNKWLKKLFGFNLMR